MSTNYILPANSPCGKLYFALHSIPYKMSSCMPKKMCSNTSAKSEKFYFSSHTLCGCIDAMGVVPELVHAPRTILIHGQVVELLLKLTLTIQNTLQFTSHHLRHTHTQGGKLKERGSNRKFRLESTQREQYPGPQKAKITYIN